MQNPELLEDIYVDSSQNSDGIVDRNLEVTLDSTSKKMLKLKNLWESMWQTDSIITLQKVFLDISYWLLDWVDKIGVFKTSLGLTAIAFNRLNKYSVKFQNISSMFTKGISEFAHLGNAVSTFGNIDIKNGFLSADDINSSVEAIKTLGDAQSVLAMKSKDLSESQMVQVLAEKGVEASQIKSALASNGLSASFSFLTTAQQENLKSTAGLTEEVLTQITAKLGLEATESGLLISKEALTTATIQEALANVTLTDEQRNALISTITLSTGQEVATGTTYGLATASEFLSGVWTTLASHPIILTLIGLTAVGYGLYKLYDKLNTSFEEQQDLFDEANEDYKEAQTNLSSIKNELEEVKERMDELNRMGSLTFVEEKELQNLKEQNDELERKLKIAQAYADLTAKKNAEEANELLTYKSEKSTEKTKVINTGHGMAEVYEDIDGIDKHNESLNKYESNLDELEALKTRQRNVEASFGYNANAYINSNEWKDLDSKISELEGEQESLLLDVSDYLMESQEQIESLKDGNGNVIPKYEDTYNRVTNLEQRLVDLTNAKKDYSEMSLDELKYELAEFLRERAVSEIDIQALIRDLGADDIQVLLSDVKGIDSNSTKESIKEAINDAKKVADSVSGKQDPLKVVLGAQVEVSGNNYEAINDFYSEMSNLQGYLEKIKNNELTSEDKTQLMLEYGISGDSLEEIQSQIDALGLEKLENITKVINDLIIINASDSTTVKMLQELRDNLADVYSESKKLTKVGDNSKGIKALDSINDEMSALDEAYASLKEGERVTSFSTLNEQFGELDGFEDFVSKISDVTSLTGDAKEAFNDLASEYITHSGILTEVTQANKNLIESQLKEMGIANASAVVQNQLTAQKEYLEQANKELTDSTIEEISEIMKEGEISETTRKYLGAYLTAKIDASNVWAVSTEEINTLLNMASSAGIAVSALEGLYKAKCLVNALESGDRAQIFDQLVNAGQDGLASIYMNTYSDEKLSKLEGQILTNYKNYIENYIKNNADTISEEIQAIYDKNKVDVTYTGGSNSQSSSSGSSSSNTSDFEQSIDYTVQSISVLEDKISRLDTKLQTAKGWKKQRDILDDMLKIQEKLTAGYGKQEKVYLGEFESSLKTLSKYVNKDEVAKARYKITSGEYFNIDKFIERNISSDVDESITEKIYNSLTEAIDHYNNALTAGQNKLNSINEEINNRKDKYQTFVDEATENISKLDAISNNTSSAEKKNKYEEKKLKWIKQQYSYQEKIYLLEGNMTKVSQNRAEKEAEILAIRQKQLENLNDQLDSERSLIELRANNLKDWGNTLATTAKNNKQDELIDNSISSINVAVKDYNTAKNKVSKSSENVKAELKKAKGLTKKQISDIKSKIKKKERIGDDLLNAVLKSGNKKLYNYLNNYNTNIDYLDIAKANKNTTVEEKKSDILDSHQQKIENISNKYENKRNTISNKTSLLDAQLENATNAKSKNKLIKQLITQANNELATYRNELDEANGLFNQSGKSVLKAKNLSKAFTPAEITQIQNCVKSGKVIPNKLLNKASQYPALYNKLAQYNAYKVMVDDATTAYNQAEAENVNTVLNHKLTQNNNISDEKKALSELYKQLQVNSTSYKEQNEYEQKSLSALEKSYRALLANALLEGDITEYKRLQAEYQKTASDSALAQLENIEKYYSNRTSINSNKASLLKSEMDIAEAKGYQLSSDYYDKLISLNNAEKSRLETKKQQLQTAFDESVATNKIVVGSDDWYSALEKIYAVEQDIQNCTKTELDYLNKINELNWANFDSLMKKISNITSESEFLLNLLGNDNLFDSAGNITSSGTASMGLHAQNYNVYMAQADEYAKKIEEVQSQLAKDPYNTTLTSKLQEYVEAQRDAILSAESEKNAIVDLVKDGYDAQFNAIEKLISKQKALLQAEKDRYSYQKNIANQEKNIVKLQKQIEALSNSTDRADIAKRLKLEQELADAMGELEDTQYEHSIETQEKAMDDALDSYKEQVENYLSDTEKVLSDALKYVNDNTSTILGSIQNKAESVGTSISDSFVTVWGNAGNAVTEYSSTFSSAITGVTSAIETIKLAWQDALSAYNEYADKTINGTVNNYKEFGSAVNTGTGSIEASNSSTDSYRNDILKILGTSSSANAEKNNGTSSLNKYLKSIGFGQLSFQEMADLYNILTGQKTTKDDFIGNSSIKKELLSYLQTWLKTNRDVVDSSFISNIGFATGGIGKLVKMSGEDGLAFVRNGEGFVAPEDVDSIKQLLKAVPLMTSLTDVVATKTVIPETIGSNSNISITAPLVNINGNLDNVTLDQLNKAIADVPKMLVKQMNKYGTR